MVVGYQTPIRRTKGRMTTFGATELFAVLLGNSVCDQSSFGVGVLGFWPIVSTAFLLPGFLARLTLRVCTRNRTELASA